MRDLSIEFAQFEALRAGRQEEGRAPKEVTFAVLWLMLLGRCDVPFWDYQIIKNAGPVCRCRLVTCVDRYRPRIYTKSRHNLELVMSTSCCYLVSSNLHTQSQRIESISRISTMNAKADAPADGISPEQVYNVNVGVMGHVDSGKTTLGAFSPIPI